MSIVYAWLAAHDSLPVVLRFWFVTPATVVLVFVGGAFFTLPPGPLCDEGMVLFMEGGCDFGNSNIFFFSKLGLLIALNAVFALAWMLRIRDVRGFAPHFLALLAITFSHLSWVECDDYYSHPNGSIGQMTLEAIAFAFLGCAILWAAQSRGALRLIALLLAWNALHISAFYAGLAFTNHWTWAHTFFIAGVLVATAGLVIAALFWRRRRLPVFAAKA